MRYPVNWKKIVSEYCHPNKRKGVKGISLLSLYRSRRFNDINNRGRLDRIKLKVGRLFKSSDCMKFG
jgi:hypothetical protein